MSLSFNPNTYAGNAAGPYIARALFGSKTLNQNLITVYQGIKRRAVIRGFDQGVIIQDATATFTPSGDTTFDERYLDPLLLSVMFEISYNDLVQSWEAAKLKPGANNNAIPSDLAAFLVAQMEAKIALSNEKLIWQGKIGSEFTFSEDYDGILSKLNSTSAVPKLAATVGQLAISGISVANPGVVTVSSTANLLTGDKVTITGANSATLVGGAAISGQTFTITVINGTTFSLGVAVTGTASTTGYAQFVNQSNVVEVLTALYNATPEAIRSQPDFVIYVPVHVADAYKLRQASVANGAGTYFTTDKPLNFLGRQIAEMPYFNNNWLLATRVSNLFFGTDLLSDFNQVQVIDMRQSTGDQKVRYRACFSSDVNFGYASEAVLYRPA